MKKSNMAWLVLLLMSLVFFGAGCATTRGIVDVQLYVPSDPGSGKAVTIVRVTDIRKFEEAPRDPSIPSLKGSEIGDKTITSRAIARKRNTYGKALGDILLPEGRTVEEVVKEALTRSFREAGYRVVEQVSVSKDEAIPVEAEIEKFWAWFTPGFWSLSLEFEANVKITGDIPPFKTGEVVRGYILLHSQAATTQAWMNTINKGIENFVQAVKKRLQTQ
jgi:hypothetical protein